MALMTVPYRGCCGVRTFVLLRIMPAQLRRSSTYMQLAVRSLQEFVAPNITYNASKLCLVFATDHAGSRFNTVLALVPKYPIRWRDVARSAENL